MHLSRWCKHVSPSLPHRCKSSTSPPSPPAGDDENACPALGLQLVDFGRGVDLELLPPGALLQVGYQCWLGW